jgi:hypothetical protein
MKRALLAGALLVPIGAFAQPAAPLARADVTLSAGAFTGRHPGDALDGPWAGTALADLTGGFYWTDHLKTEVAVGWTGEATAIGSELQPEFVYFFRRYENRLISLSQAYQFGRNAYVHPFVAGGIEVDRERYTIDRPIQSAYRAPGLIVTLPAQIETGRRTRVRPFATAGLKLYTSARMFFRTDLKAAVRHGIDQVAWKAGFGIDF